MPARCVACRQTTTNTFCLCHACSAELETNSAACVKCGNPVTAAEGHTCGKCQQEQPTLDRCHAPLRYAGHLRELIVGLKFHEKLIASNILTALFAQHARIENRPDILIPVPLHPSRLKERGYNQAVLLAQSLGRQFNIPVGSEICSRKLNTLRQSDLPMKAKKQNVRGAFDCHKPLHGLHIAIIDDVMTSGHTLNELAVTLKHNGAMSVDAWVMAKAGLKI